MKKIKTKYTLKEAKKLLEKEWNKIPWYVKLLLVLSGLYWLKGKKGIFWQGLKGMVILIGMLLIYPLLAISFIMYKIYLKLALIQISNEGIMCIVAIIFFSVCVVFMLIIYDFAIYYRNNKSEDNSKGDKNAI